MNRREALKRVAWLMGGAVSAPLTLAVRNGYSATTPGDGKPSLLTQSQADIVSAVAEIMIPRTDTPGAIDAGVPGFIDLMLEKAYTEEDRRRYLTGLDAFDAAAQGEHRRKFIALEPPQQIALVRKFHDAAVAEERRLNQPPGTLKRPFVLMTKELTLLGFFTSRVGASRVLQYQAVPGSYHACIPLAQAGNGKTWAVESGEAF